MTLKITWSALCALLACSVAPDAIGQVFQDATAGSGLAGFPLDDSRYDFVHGMGMCAADFDRDGDLDLVVPEGETGLAFRFFRNDGALRFSDQTARAGLGTTARPRACRAADVDNDGDVDLFVSNHNNPPALFINDGTGAFSEEAALRGIVHDTSGWSAGFGDYDCDGWVDLSIGNRFVENQPGRTEPNILYRNTGNGYFVDVTRSAGVEHAQGATLFTCFFDYDEDRWPDIFVGNDKGASYAPNEIYRNLGDGTFTPVGAAIGAADVIDAMGIDFVDVFNDGGIDFYVSDLPPDHLFRRWDSSSQRYVDDTLALGLQGGYLGWAVHFLDADNDGWQDLHVVHLNGPNHLYRNPGQPPSARAPWPEVAGPLAPTTWQITAIAADFDDDGRIDLLHRMVQYPFGGPTQGLLLHRNVSPQRSWLKVRTIGTVSNRDGFGARIEVEANGVRQRQYVRAGVGYHSTNDHRCHFGLGSASTADVTVVWPSGQVQELRGVALNRTLVVTEPSMRVVGVPTVGGSCTIEVDCPDDVGRNYAVMLSFRDTPHTPLFDGHVLPLLFDELCAATLAPGNGVLHGSVGPLVGGRGVALFAVPPIPSAAGVRVYTTAFTYDPTSLPFGTFFPEALPIDIQ